jgi:hypothetical protein
MTAALIVTPAFVRKATREFLVTEILGRSFGDENQLTGPLAWLCGSGQPSVPTDYSTWGIASR